MYVVSKIADVKQVSIDWVHPLLKKSLFEDQEVWAIYGRVTLHLTNGKSVSAAQSTEFIEVKPAPAFDAQTNGISWLSTQSTITPKIQSSPAFAKMWSLLASLKSMVPAKPTLQDMYEPEKALASARKAISSEAAQDTVAKYQSCFSFQNRLANPLWLVLPEMKNAILYRNVVWTWTDPVDLKLIFAFFRHLSLSTENETFDEVIANELVHDQFLAAQKSTVSLSRRSPISEIVRHEVWRRDQGRCVNCGSQDKLEFDHIIPYSRGGSDTARNLQLLCELCNRQKSAKI